LQSIFSTHRRSYEAAQGERLSPHARLALRKITECRTPALGGQGYVCAECGHEHYYYHSCNHRLCPQCGGHEAHVWCEAQSAALLPEVTYFMVTPTLPGSLRKHARCDEKRWYDWFFEATSSAISDLMADAKGEHGGQAGFFGILQTWTRDLRYHLHIHYIVPSGVLMETKQKVPGQRKKVTHRQWKPGPQRNSGTYLLNAYALQKAIRRRMEQIVKRDDPALYATLPRSVWRESWRCDVKAVGSGLSAVRYLARYVTKSALSNQQLHSHRDGRVTYSYTPNDGKKQSKLKTLEAHEFMSSVLIHALPKGFKRVRHFGWLHPSAQKRLEHVKLLCGKTMMYQQKGTEPEQIKEPLRCRKCRSERVEVSEPLLPLKGIVKACWEREAFGEAVDASSEGEEGSASINGSRAPPAVSHEKEVNPTP
jgi:predicted Zn-ribbon and HTH transcriptional regulator